MNPPLVRPIRCLITSGDSTSSNFQSQRDQLLETVRLAVAAGIELVQIREKRLPTRLLFEVSTAAADIVHGSGTKLLINERFDVALVAGADGVHLTSTSMPAGQVRANVPSEFIVGVSTHSMREVIEAKDRGVDYAFFGPVFPTPGKEDVQGLEELARVCEAVTPFPVLAIGGIDAGNAESVVFAGAAGFAAIRYLNDFVRIAK